MKPGFGVKAAAVFLCLLSCATALVGMLGAFWMFEKGFYYRDESNAVRSVIEEEMASRCAYLALNAAGALEYGGSMDRLFSSELLQYKVTLGDQMLWSSYTGAPIRYSATSGSMLISSAELSAPETTRRKMVTTALADSVTEVTEVEVTWENVDTTAAAEDAAEPAYGDDAEQMSEENVLRVTAYYPEQRGVTDLITTAEQWLQTGWRWRYAVIAIAAGAVLLNIISYLFLLSCAGYRRDGEVRLNFLDRIPFDVYLALLVCAGGIGIALLDSIQWAAALCVGIFGGYSLFLLLSCSFAARIRAGGLLSRMLCVRIVRIVWRAVRTLLGNLPLIWKAVVALTAIFFWDVICFDAVRYGGFFGVMLYLSGWTLIAGFVLYEAICFGRVEKGCRGIAEGNINEKISLNWLSGRLRNLAKTINHLQDGLSKAVEERMKSEHFRTELITNVSHDLKTPLTSIVNYIDLLKKENIDDPTAREYIEVLERQSARLKKLTEDLVEASKASTGNLEVQLSPCELGEFLCQTAGEYKERMRSRELTLIVSTPDYPLHILADGRYLWRVFDNLLSNVCKYTQAQTRVYLTLDSHGGRAYIIFRSISRYPLNVSGEELMERFVRGDASRHTEGSGLGLSIARSLTELQKGDMEITVDGDLFKVTLSFPLVFLPAEGKPEEKSEETAALLSAQTEKNAGNPHEEK